MRLTKNRLNKLDNIINECISEVLYENKLRGNILMENKSINITNDIRSYLKMSVMGEMGDADMSKRACELHERLMDMMSLDHLDSNDRMSFARILSFLGKLLKVNADVQIYVDGSYINYTINGELCNNYIDIEDGPEVYDENVYQTWDGVVIDDMDYYDYGGGQVSEDIRSAHLTDEIINKIKGMGLVPALYITGSFHEKFAKAIGIIPGEANKLNNEDGIYFECKK